MSYIKHGKNIGPSISINLIITFLIRKTLFPFVFARINFINHILT